MPHALHALSSNSSNAALRRVGPTLCTSTDVGIGVIWEHLYLRTKTLGSALTRTLVKARKDGRCRAHTPGELHVHGAVLEHGQDRAAGGEGPSPSCCHITREKVLLRSEALNLNTSIKMFGLP